MPPYWSRWSTEESTATTASNTLACGSESSCRRILGFDMDSGGRTRDLDGIRTVRGRKSLCRRQPTRCLYHATRCASWRLKESRCSLHKKTHGLLSRGLDDRCEQFLLESLEGMFHRVFL